MPSTIEKRLGARVRKYRLAAGKTQEALAIELDVTSETVSRLERGTTIPSLKTLSRLADQLGVDVKDLFDFSAAREDRNGALDDLVNYLRGRHPEDIALVHRLAHTVFNHIDQASKPRRGRSPRR